MSIGKYLGNVVNQIMISGLASQTENAAIPRRQARARALVRKTAVSQTARGSYAQPRSAALFATNVSTGRWLQVRRRYCEHVRKERKYSGSVSRS